MSLLQTRFSCSTLRKSFSSYLDGAVNGREMQAIAAHLESCPACNTEFTQWRIVQETLTSMRAKAPQDLSLRLRLAISREHAARRSDWRDTFSLAWANTLRPLALQASAGLACAITLIGTIAFLLGVVTPPNAVLANDEPLGVVTTPHYLYSVVRPRPILLDARPSTAPMVVEAEINSEGRVYDYSVISAPEGPDAPAIQAQIADQLLLSVFKPASVFGVPVKGRLILTFVGVPLHA
jgi:hypothetical protein